MIIGSCFSSAMPRAAHSCRLMSFQVTRGPSACLARTELALVIGGNVDPIDRDVTAWSRLFPSDTHLSEEVERTQLMKLCAVRETFEECGILLLEGSDDSRAHWAAVPEAERRKWRKRVHGSGPDFIELFQSLAGDQQVSQARPALTSLRFVGNWITPASVPRRFDTHFFISILPPSSRTSHEATEMPHQYAASADNTEMTSLDWLTPREAIDRTSSSKDSMVLYPPQFYLLAELVRVKSWRDLAGDETDNSGRPLPRARRVEPLVFEPRKVKDESGNERTALVLVGDVAHSKTVNAEPSDRHRTYDLKGSMSIIGVHRQGE